MPTVKEGRLKQKCMKNKNLILAIIILQIAFLSGMILFHNAKLRTADRILLKTVPLDPVSIFRGHYVALRYEISSLPVDLLIDANPKGLKSGDDLFVLLKKDAGFWKAEAIYRKPHRKAGEVYLHGRLGYFYQDYYKYLNLKYDIESFFLNEVSAKDVEQANMRGGRNWQERERIRKDRLSQLDEETQRINKAVIGDWWVNILNKELEVWARDGIITTEVKDTIHNKYAQAIKKIKAIDQDLSASASSNQRPIIVEVAVDHNGYGYPTRLFVDGKVYK